MENAAAFVDEILWNYYQKIHQYMENNWDIYRFGFDGIDRSKDFDINNSKRMNNNSVNVNNNLVDVNIKIGRASCRERV